MGTYCITGLWLSLTILFTSGVIFAMLSPVWFENTRTIEKFNSTTQLFDANKIVTLGLLRFCRINEIDDVMFQCKFFTNLKDMPSVSWIIATIIFSIGACLFVLSVILATFGMCAEAEKDEKLRIGIAYIQIIAVGFLSISILIFPLGLDSDFARDICGSETNMYVPDQCQVAWGYVLGIMAISLTIFCPILAKYSTDLRYNDDYDDHFEYSECESKCDLVSLSTSSNSKVMTTV